jgi:hypothetical protein
MRRRKIRRELAALGHKPHTPNDQTRAKVRILAFNKTPPEVIANYLSIHVDVLRYWYSRELDLTETEVLAMAAENVLALASQRGDLGVSLRANELVLRTRSRHWREPKAEEPPIAALAETKRPDRLTLEEVEAELARIDAPVGRSADAAPAAGTVDPESAA